MVPGPVLGLILTGAALNGANVGTSLLLLSYAVGAATSLALVLLLGGRVFATMKRSLGAAEWVKKGLGIAVLVAVVAVASGLDTGLLTNISFSNTAALEQRLSTVCGHNRNRPKIETGPRVRSGPQIDPRERRGQRSHFRNPVS